MGKPRDGSQRNSLAIAVSVLAMLMCCGCQYSLEQEDWHRSISKVAIAADVMAKMNPQHMFSAPQIVMLVGHPDYDLTSAEMASCLSMARCEIVMHRITAEAERCSKIAGPECKVDSIRLLVYDESKHFAVPFSPPFCDDDGFIAFIFFVWEGKALGSCVIPWWEPLRLIASSSPSSLGIGVSEATLPTLRARLNALTFPRPLGSTIEAIGAVPLKWRTDESRTLGGPTRITAYYQLDAGQWLVVKQVIGGATKSQKEGQDMAAEIVARDGSCP